MRPRSASIPDIEARLALDLETPPAGLIVCDVIPNPPRTRLLQDAAERGCTVLDGLGMLVNQGVIGIRLWSGREPEPRRHAARPSRTDLLLIRDDAESIGT